MKFGTLFLPLALLLGACSGVDDTEVATSDEICTSDSILVTDAWMRPTPAGQPVGAAFVTICNGTKHDIVLTGASFTGAATTEIHVSNITDDNITSMSHTPSITITAGTKMRLQPGNTHIMLIDLKSAYAPGDAPHLSLKFKDERPITAHLIVRKKAPTD